MKIIKYINKLYSDTVSLGTYQAYQRLLNFQCSPSFKRLVPQPYVFLQQMLSAGTLVLLTESYFNVLHLGPSHCITLDLLSRVIFVD
jgi:hypothetical protein